MPKNKLMNSNFFFNYCIKQYAEFRIIILFKKIINDDIFKLQCNIQFEISIELFSNIIKRKQTKSN